MTSPFVSVVVPAYNAEKTISLALNAILDQTYKNMEIIVVDDGSTDTTASLAQEFLPIRYIYQKNAGPAAARNTGANEAKGEILFFTDSDCIPYHDWLEKAIKHFDDPHVGVVAGSYGIANRESLLARCIYKEILFRHARMPIYPKSFGSYNFGIRKKVFEEVGGFHTGYRHASGEDNDLSYKVLKVGYKIYFEKNALVKHYHPRRLKIYLFEQYRHGFWRVKMYGEHPHMLKGDDYTFWKDMVEVALVYTLPVAAVFSRQDIPFLMLKMSLTGFLLLEVMYGWLMTKDLREGIFFSVVMFLRAFARTWGFTLGLMAFLSKKDK